MVAKDLIRMMHVVESQSTCVCVCVHKKNDKFAVLACMLHWTTQTKKDESAVLTCTLSHMIDAQVRVQ